MDPTWTQVFSSSHPGALNQADVDEVVPEAGAFRVLVRVPGGLTAHVLRMPSAKDVIEYRRAFARILDLAFNKQELT